MENKNKFTISRNAEKNLTIGLSIIGVLFFTTCLPVLVIAAILYWIFGG